MQSEFPHLKALLQEDDDDIVSGLRSLISTIRSGWSSNLSGTKKQQLNLWKKLTSAQQARMKTTFSNVVSKLFTAPNQVIDTSVIDASDKNEAAFIVATFATLATGAAEIDRNFLNIMVQNGAIEKKDRDLFMSNYKGTGPMDVTLGDITATFLTDHRDLLKRLVDVREDTIGFDVAAVTNNLVTALNKTPAEKKAEAVKAVHYLLLDMSHEFNEANSALGQKFSSATLPDSEKKV